MVGRTAVVVGFCVYLSGCSEREPPAQDAQVDSATASADSVVRSANKFDPARIEPGDTFLGLRVAAKDVRLTPDTLWSGEVRFAGELQLTGVYQPHFDYPEPAALCFHVTDSTSVARLPRFAPDKASVPGSKHWFCFTNPDSARTLLGAPPTPREATVIVDDYIVRRYFTDAYDSARLLRVVSIGDTTRQTLRDPR